MLKAKNKIFLIYSLIVFNCLSQSYLQEGNNHYKNGEYLNAIISYKKAIGNSESQALGWFNLGNAYYQNKELAKTVACYENAVVEAPEFARGWQNLGVIYYEMGDYGACIASLRKVILLKKQNATVLSVLSAAHKELEDFGHATVFMEQALELDSASGEAYLMLYEIARSNGDNQEALKWLGYYPEKGSRFYDVTLIKSELLVEQGDSSKALSILRKCTVQNPERDQGWVDLVSLLYKMGMTYMAAIEAEKGIAAVKNPAFLALVAGQFAFNASYLDKAEKFYKIAFDHGRANGVTGLSNVMLAYKKYGDEAGVERVKSVLEH